jgi:hypothetical protein
VEESFPSPKYGAWCTQTTPNADQHESIPGVGGSAQRKTCPRKRRGQLSPRRLNFLVQRPILEIRLEEFCRGRQLYPEIIHYANLHLTAAKPIVQGVSSGLFILPKEVQVKSRHTDTLRISRRAKSGQGPLHISEDFLRLMFRCLCESRKRPGLTLHCSCADFIEYAIHSHGAEQVGICQLLNQRQKFALRHWLRQV